MAFKSLVTQDELKTTIAGLNALADNLSEHVNQSLSKAHGWSIIDTAYLDSGGIYQTDFGQSGFASIPGLSNTGVNNDGTLAAPGSVDTHWSLILSPDPAAPGPSAFIASPLTTKWSSNGPKSQWISPAADSTKQRKKGSYKWRVTFNLSGFNPASALIKGSWVSDDKTTTVLLNGIVTGITGPANFSKQPSAGTAFSFNTGFVAGVNTLDFIVSNSGGGPTGIRVEVTGVASSGGVFPVPGLFNTGVNGSGVVLPQGSIDPHWTLIESSDPSNPGPNLFLMKLGGGYAPNTSLSAWIGPRVSGNVPTGNYKYRLSFDLTGFSPNTTILRGQFWSNDITQNVYLNGVALGLTNTNNGKKYPTVFVITTGFVSGINTLDFVVHTNNQDSGLRVEVTGTSSNSGTGLTSRVLRLTIGGNVFYFPCQQSGGLDGTPDPTIPSFSGIISPQSADPATDLTVGSPTPAELVTTFSDTLNAIANAASDTLLQHAGDQPESVHSGLSFQSDSIVNTAGNLVGRRTVNILINGVQYKIVGDFSPNGPLP